MVEEADRIAVLSRVGASVVDLLKIGGKLGLLEGASGYIRVGTDDLPPRGEIRGERG